MKTERIIDLLGDFGYFVTSSGKIYGKEGLIAKMTRRNFFDILFDSSVVVVPYTNKKNYSTIVDLTSKLEKEHIPFMRKDND